MLYITTIALFGVVIEMFGFIYTNRVKVKERFTYG